MTAGRRTLVAQATHGGSRGGDLVDPAARGPERCRRGACSRSSPARSSRWSSSALPILTASVLAVAAAVLTGLLRPADAYAGFGNGTILLIVVAFLVAERRGEVRPRHARRPLDRQPLRPVDARLVVFHLPARRGHRARVSEQHGAVGRAVSAGVLAGRRGGRDAGSAGSAAARRVPDVLGDRSLSVSSALWLTAMAANPLGTEIARGAGVEIGFSRWLIASSVPTLCAMVALPLLLYRVIGPEVTSTPEAPAAARQALAALGPLSRHEWIVLRGLRRHGGALGRRPRRSTSTRPPSRFLVSECCSQPESSPSRTSPRRATSWPPSSGLPCSSRSAAS